MKDFVCCCSTGFLSGGAGSSDTDGLQDVKFMNLNQKEVSTYQHESLVVYLPCATMPQRNMVVLVQCESRLSSVEVLVGY